MKECYGMYEWYERKLKTWDSLSFGVSAFKHALAGFIYTGENKSVICSCCEKAGYKWLPNHDSVADHLMRHILLTNQLFTEIK